MKEVYASSDEHGNEDGFFFQAEDGIRDQPRSRGLGDVYKRQDYQGIRGDITMQTPGRASPGT